MGGGEQPAPSLALPIPYPAPLLCPAFVFSTALITFPQSTQAILFQNDWGNSDKLKQQWWYL